MISRFLPLAARLAVAILSVAVAALLTWALGGRLGPTPLVFFYLATMLIAWLGGLVPGLVAALL